MSADEAQSRQVLVIGGAGYVGNVLIRELLSRGYSVRCLDCLLYPTGATVAPLLDDPDFSFVLGDLRDPEAMKRGLEGSTDVVLLASLVGDPITKKFPELARDVNDRGSKQAIEMAAAHGVGRFVFTSTCSNYGVYTGADAATEDSPLDPRSVYAETKVEIERFLLERAPSAAMASTILRLSTAFGLSQRMRFDLTVSEFSRELAAGRELLVYDESTWRPYCHLLDISEAIIRVLEAPRQVVAGQVFNVGGDQQNYTKQMIVDEVRKVLPDAKVAYNAGGGDPRDYRVSFEKIKSALGYEPRQSIADSVRRVVQGVEAGLFDDVEARRDFYGNYAVRAL